MHPDHPDDRMPGVRDYELTLPFTRRIDGIDEITTIKARIPAKDAGTAMFLGDAIALSIDFTGTDAWQLVPGKIGVVDVDDTRSPAELAAEVEHLRRIVTVLAGKMPGLATVGADEYQAADWSTVVVVPINDTTMLFTTDAALTAASAGPASVTEPAPDGVELPAPYGGHRDPDVRAVPVKALPMCRPKEIEVLHEGQWMLLAGTNMTADLTVTLTCLPPDGEFVTVDGLALTGKVIARPATVEGQATDLPAAERYGRQVLTGAGWRTVAAAEYMGPTASAYKVVLVDNPSKRNALGAVVIGDGDVVTTTSYSRHEPVLLRDTPGSWWS